MTSDQMQVIVGCEAPEYWRSVDRAEHHTTAERWRETMTASDRLWEEGSDEEETNEQIFWTLTGDEEMKRFTLMNQMMWWKIKSSWASVWCRLTRSTFSSSWRLISQSADPLIRSWQKSINNCDRKENHEVFRSSNKVSHCENTPLQEKVLHLNIYSQVQSISIKIYLKYQK